MQKEKSSFQNFLIYKPLSAVLRKGSFLKSSLVFEMSPPHEFDVPCIFFASNLRDAAD